MHSVYRRFTGLLAEEAEAVIAVDFMESFTQKNRENNGHHRNTDFRCCDVTKLDLPPNRWDIQRISWWYRHSYGMIFNIFLNDMFYFVSKGDLYNYADDNCISVSHKESVVSAQLENETQLMTKWFADNSMKANVDKFQGIILSGGRNNTAIQVSLDDVDIAFVQKIDVLGVCIDGKLNFNEHVCRICSKASAQISALHRLTGLLDYPSRKAIYTSFIASNFNYCPLVWFFTSRENIDKIDKIQERALRFVLKDHISDYTNLLLKSGFDSFRIYAVKYLMIELFKILEGITPNYLSDLFVKADNPYDIRDTHKLIQPLKRTTTYGLRSFQYYGAHVWIMLPINIKAAQSLHEFKSLIRSWPGPKCSCHICIALLWLMLLSYVLHTVGEGCRCDDYVVACGTVSLWQQPVVPWSRHSDSHPPPISLAQRQNGRHSAADDIFECILLNEN